MVKSFADISEAISQNKLKKSVGRTLSGLKNDIKLETALKKSKDKKKKSKSSISKAKILKKPTTKLPSYSATKVVKQLADEQNRLVREVPEKEIVEDKRSLFFKKEYVGERKWLS